RRRRRRSRGGVGDHPRVLSQQRGGQHRRDEFDEIVTYIWLIPLLPAVGALVNGLVGVRCFSRRTAGVVACTTMIAALGVSIVAFWQLLGLPATGEAAREYHVVVAQW